VTPCHECRKPSEDGICHQCLERMFQPVDMGHPKDRDPDTLAPIADLVIAARAACATAKAAKERKR
jgi:hypothetical protein